MTPTNPQARISRLRLREALARIESETIDYQAVRLARDALADVPAEVPRDDRREQAISFAYGNVRLHNPAVTREMVAAQYDELHPAAEAVETRKEWRAAWISLFPYRCGVGV